MIGVDPLQVPFDTVSVCPAASVPVICGGAVFAGAVTGAAAATLSVHADCAEVDPTAFVAVTVTATWWPLASAVGVYDWAVAPAWATQPYQAVSHTDHW